jgi:hypothetical protein
VEHRVCGAVEFERKPERFGRRLELGAGDRHYSSLTRISFTICSPVKLPLRS